VAGGDRCQKRAVGRVINDWSRQSKLSTAYLVHEEIADLLAGVIVAPFCCDNRERLSALDPVHQLRRSGPAGIAKAKAAGVYKGRKPSVDVSQVRALKEKGIGPSLGIGRASVYRALGEHT
jgi:hypothetical protein